MSLALHPNPGPSPPIVHDHFLSPQIGGGFYDAGIQVEAKLNLCWISYFRVPHDTSYFYLIRTLRSICSNAGAIRPKSLSGEMKIRYRKELSRPCRVTSQSRSLMEPFCPCTGESPTRYTDLPGTRFIRTFLASPSTRKPGFDRRKESSKSRVV